MGLDNNSDRDLLERIKTANELAFRKAYNEYQNKLYGLAFRYLRTRQQSEDVVQNTFVPERGWIRLVFLPNS